MISALVLFALTLPSVSGVPIIFDTDMDSDCDDVGALAVLHALASRGEAEILATVVSSRNEWSPACVDAINTFYGRPDLPIGCPKQAGAQKPSKYARQIAERFPHDVGPADKVPDAMQIYRAVLSAQSDNSVVIVTVGYLTNMADLLKLPADGAQPSGLQLVQQKVKLWVCMGGNFVGRPAIDDLKLSNNNFTYDKTSAHEAIRNWPGQVMFVGREIGSVPSGLKAGARLRQLPEANPIRAGYALWFGGEPQDRHVADQTAVLFAVRGLRDYWAAESQGWMDLQPDMTFRWRFDQNKSQGYLVKRQVDGRPNDRAIEQVIEELMLEAAAPGATRAAKESPFAAHGKLRVAKSGTHLEHADGTPFFFLGDTAWSGPALSTDADWKLYLADRKRKGYTAIQFNAVCPWRAASTNLAGRTAYSIKDGQLVPNEDYFRQLDARLRAINGAGLLAAPVLVWAHKPGDAGFDLSEQQILDLVTFELRRYHDADCLFILAGDARYNQADADKWKRIGRAALKDFPGLLVTTHPTGMNFPWDDWENEKWLNVIGYQSGHGDDAGAVKWIHSGPVAEYGRQRKFTRPVINLEPAYEDHNGYQSRKPHPAYHVRRAVYQSLLAAPVAGFTYGGHGVWSWHTRPGEEPTDHKGSGVAKVWKEALQLPGAGQMGHVRKLFESLPWTELRPGQEFVGQEAGKNDPTRFVSCAAATKRGVYVYYFPAGAKAHVLLHIRGIDGAMEWFNPRTGQWGDPQNAKPDRNVLEPPDEDDWVLVVKP